MYLIFEGEALAVVDGENLLDGRKWQKKHHAPMDFMLGVADHGVGKAQSGIEVAELCFMGLRSCKLLF